MTDDAGWIWEVTPRLSTDTVVALGHSGTEEDARSLVELSLKANEATAGHGFVIGPAGQHDICRRAREGFHWQPLWERPEPVT
jgi:hypothetical protein